MEQQTERALIKLCLPEEAIHLVDLLEQIAAELSWQPGQQMRAYASQAVHFAAYADGILAGGMQLVPAMLCEMLPCELVWPDVHLPQRAQTAHISIMALCQEYRGTAKLLWPLCVAMWRYCAVNGITSISLEVTPKLFHLYKRLGWPLEIIGDLRLHWGEPCLLCRMGTVDVAGAMVLKATRSQTYQAIVAMMSQPCV